MDRRTSYEQRTQKLELQTLSSNQQWHRLGYFRTVIAARKAAPPINGIYYRILGDDEVKEMWQAKTLGARP
jgi:hypothetical protein